MAKDELHVMMLPWSAFGHLIPFFQLSIALAKSGIKVSFISTPKNILRLPPIPPNLQSFIEFVHFPMPVAGENPLPEGVEATVDISFSEMDSLKIAYDLLQPPLKKFVLDQKPDWFVTDFASYWMCEICDENRVPLIFFSIFPASSMLFLTNPECLTVEGQKRFRPSWESLTSKPEWIDFPSSLAYRKHEAISIFRGAYTNNASGISDVERVCKILSSCNALAIRSCTEFEGDYLNKFQELFRKPVIPVGSLPVEKPESRKLFSDESWNRTFQWLDQQKPKSVVYVAFGSEYALSKDQVFEIAYGLEQSGLPFIWAVKKPNWANNDLDTFPVGFSDRIHGKGIVSLKWAPQMEILGHPSVGGSLIHSGWGSVNETLQFGHCSILLPFAADQPLIARNLVEKGLGVEVERNEEDGSFTRDGISKALRLAMESDISENLRVRAIEAAGIFGNHKLQQDCIDKFVEFLQTKQYKSS